MTMVNMHEAKTQLSKLVARAEAGEDVVIARDGRPAARLTAVVTGDDSTSGQRLLGAWKGQVEMSDNFDDPMPELEQAIYGDRE